MLPIDPIAGVFGLFVIEVGGRRPGEIALVLVGVHQDGDAKLTEIGETLDLPGLLASAAERWQQEGDEEGDDADHHHKLDERKATANRVHGRFLPPRRQTKPRLGTSGVSNPLLMNVPFDLPGWSYTDRSHHTGKFDCQT